MPAVCEHEFEREDPNNPGYSMTEYDLYARLGLTLRRNLKFNEYELAKISTGAAQFGFKTLQEAIAKANELEGTENTWVECRHRMVIENVSKIKDF